MDDLDRCGLCGTSLSGTPATTAACRSACPLGTGCSLRCCPGCGSGVPSTRTGLAGRLRRWLDARRERAQARAAALAGTLAQTPAGTRVRVETVDLENPILNERLGAFGITVGSEIVLAQHRPTLVLQAGETTVAIEPSLARFIRVGRPQTSQLRKA